MSLSPFSTPAAAAPPSGKDGWRPRLAPTVVVYVAIVLAVTASVLMAERSISRRRAADRVLDAERAALVTTSFLSIHVGALRGLQTIFVGDLPSSAEIDVALSTMPVGEGGFQGLWFVDTSGRVLREARYLPGGGTQMRVGTRIDTVAATGVAQIVRAAAASRTVIVRATQDAGPDSASGVYMAMAAFHGDTLLGFVGGFVGSATLHRQLRIVAPPSRTAVTILAGDDTVVRHVRRYEDGDGPPSFTHLEESGAEIALPARTRALRGEWTAVVEHGHTPWADLALWSLPLAFAILLGITFRHERRYMRRLSERSQELETLSGELMAANRSKSEFLANVSHELRTPLNAIVGFTDLLRDGVYGPLTPRQLGPLERIDVSSAHLRQLVDQILDLAKMASGRMDMHPEPLALRPFVFDVATEIESLISDQGLALSLSVPSTLPRVRTDPLILRQILLNLLGNAVKFTESGGISVRAKLVQADPQAVASPTAATTTGEQTVTAPPNPALNWIALQVVDTGIGIDPADQARIFDEFEQVNPGARGDSMERGTGLGLALARRMARLLGGDVTVESALGAGSIFTLWIPVRPADMTTPVVRRTENPAIA